MKNKKSLPTRKSYSLSRAVEYINGNLDEKISILDLFHYIKHFGLRTVFRMSGVILTEDAFLTSVCENEITGKKLYNLGIQYHNGEYSRKDLGGLLKTLKQSFNNDFLKLTISNSLFDDTEKRPLFTIKSFDKELINFTGFNNITFDGFFELDPSFYTGTDEELSKKDYLELETYGIFNSALPEPLEKVTNIYFTIKSDELLKIPYSGIEILHQDLERFINRDNEKDNKEKELSPKSETAYLNIIGALLETALKSGQFKNQAELIAHLEQHYQGYAGLSESNLKMKFATANKSLSLV